LRGFGVPLQQPVTGSRVVVAVVMMMVLVIVGLRQVHLPHVLADQVHRKVGDRAVPGIHWR
jgi:hypothetical protein